MAAWNIGLLALGIFHQFLSVDSISPQELELAEDVGDGRFTLPENFHPHSGSLVYDERRHYALQHPVHQMLRGVSTITHLYGDIVVEGTENLEFLGVFLHLVYVEGSIRITGNRALQSLGGFPKLRRVSGSIVFSNNVALERITTRHSRQARPLPRHSLFPALRQIGSLEILQNPQLFHGPQMPALEQCTGDINISENNRIEAISGFQNLINVAGLHISSNNRLREIDAFPMLKMVNGDFIIEDHPRFNSFGAFGRLEEVNGDFTVVRNRYFIKLDWLEAFSRLTVVGGSLDIRGNGYDHADHIRSNQLSNVNGLRRLRTVGGSLNIQRIEQSGQPGHLRSQTAGLCGLQSVGGEISVKVFFKGPAPDGCRAPWSLDFDTENLYDGWRRLTRRVLWDKFKIWLRSCDRTCNIEGGPQKQQSLRGGSPASNRQNNPNKKETKQCENYHGDKIRCHLKTEQQCQYQEGKCIPVDA